MERVGKLSAHAVVVMLAASACSSATVSDVARFELAQPAAAKDRFVIELRDPAKIAHARALLAGIVNSPAQVMGVVVKSAAAYNATWSYHLDPTSITFFDMATEVCDATARYVEEHLSEVGGAFLPGSRWCPWRSALVSEVPVR